MTKRTKIPALIAFCAFVGVGIAAFAQSQRLATTEEEPAVRDRDGEEHGDREHGDRTEKPRREGSEVRHAEREFGEHRERGEVKEKDGDIEKLFQLVRQARAELRVLRAQVGIPGERVEGRREGRGEHAEGGREGRGEHAEGRREGRGEHAEGGREGRGDEEGGKRLRKNETWSETRNGARLILAFDAATQSFKGIVRNTTPRTLSDVRVEVHLSNGVELGPTKRTDLKPGARVRVELSAADQRFTWWTTHPEHGSEEGHGPGHEEGRGEHAEGGGSRPKAQELRPLYNELQLLRNEIRVFSRDLKSRRR